jgi:hypothetical protein
MERQIRYGTIFLLVLIAGLCLYGFVLRVLFSGPAIAKADLSLTAKELTQAFDQNEAHSDSLYLHKALAVSGMIRTITDDGSGGFTVTMSGKTPGGTAVDCRLDTRENRRLDQLKAGDSIRLLGICVGRLGDVVLVQCIIDKRG